MSSIYSKNAHRTDQIRDQIRERERKREREREGALESPKAKGGLVVAEKAHYTD